MVGVGSDVVHEHADMSGKDRSGLNLECVEHVEQMSTLVANLATCPGQRRLLRLVAVEGCEHDVSVCDQAVLVDRVAKLGRQTKEVALNTVCHDGCRWNVGHLAVSRWCKVPVVCVSIFHSRRHVLEASLEVHWLAKRGATTTLQLSRSLHQVYTCR